MAQFAFAKVDDISPGITGTLSITFSIRIVWVGDQLAGGDMVNVTWTRGQTVLQFRTSVENTIIARAAEIGFPTMAATDIRYLGGALFG